ncbi:MAG TPA: zinc-binding dehydrogenase [Vicinamibacterales bacterium]|nr:zinc-binding dehydrogenase [Vicinamibacterales bacterium]
MVIPRYGPPDVLGTREQPDLKAGDGQIRIAVQTAGVNFADVLARLGLYPDAPKPPAVVGYEVCGIVDQTGAGVTTPRVGDRVIALTRFGGYADQVVVPASFAFPVPAAIDAATAAAIPVNYVTALIALYRMANITTGETVLVHGAGGGVGIAATQLAKLRGATVVGTASAAKHDAIRAFGVDHAIDYRNTDVVAEVRRLTNDRGVDVVLDPIGGRSFASSYRMLAPLGRMVAYGVSSVATGERRNLWRALTTIVTMPRFNPLSLMDRNRGVFGLNLGHLWSERERLAEAMTLLIDEVAAGRLRPIVARTFPLDRAADAHRFIQSRSNIGKVVLTT